MENFTGDPNSKMHPDNPKLPGPPRKKMDKKILGGLLIVASFISVAVIPLIFYFLNDLILGSIGSNPGTWPSGVTFAMMLFNILFGVLELVGFIGIIVGIIVLVRGFLKRK